MGDEEMLSHYSRALDEIYALRTLLAHEALELTNHCDLRSFPDGRRERAAASIRRMSTAAQGHVSEVYPEVRGIAKDVLRIVGADDCLTRAQWEGR